MIVQALEWRKKMGCGCEFALLIGNDTEFNWNVCEKHDAQKERARCAEIVRKVVPRCFDREEALNQIEHPDGERSEQEKP